VPLKNEGLGVEPALEASMEDLDISFQDGWAEVGVERADRVDSMPRVLSPARGAGAA